MFYFLYMARYGLDDEEGWSGMEEILRIVARTRLDLPLRQDNLAQPYRVAKVPPKHTIHVLYEFNTSNQHSDFWLRISSSFGVLRHSIFRWPQSG